MQPVLLCTVLTLAVGATGWEFWRRRCASPSVKKAKYKALEKRAKTGDREAMYALAKCFYRETDARFYPLIFKWVSLLAAQKRDPAVWLQLGDMYASGCGTDKDLKRSLSCYEQALAADITAYKNTSLTAEAHNYLEKRMIYIRKELSR